MDEARRGLRGERADTARVRLEAGDLVQQPSQLDLPPAQGVTPARVGAAKVSGQAPERGAAAEGSRLLPVCVVASAPKARPTMDAAVAGNALLELALPNVNTTIPALLRGASSHLQRRGSGRAAEARGLTGETDSPFARQWSSWGFYGCRVQSVRRRSRAGAFESSAAAERKLGHLLASAMSSSARSAASAPMKSRGPSLPPPLHRRNVTLTGRISLCANLVSVPECGWQRSNTS